MISIVQNFICTKEERLELLRKNIPQIGKMFGEYEFFVNYGTTINLDEVYNLYKKYIPKLNFYNSLEKDWAAVTLSLSNEITTPYTMFICEDMIINSSKSKIDKCIKEYFDEGLDYFLITKIDKYIQQNYIDGYTPYNSVKSPGYKKLKNGEIEIIKWNEINDRNNS